MRPELATVSRGRCSLTPRPLVFWVSLLFFVCAKGYLLRTRRLPESLHLHVTLQGAWYLRCAFQQCERLSWSLLVLAGASNCSSAHALLLLGLDARRLYFTGQLPVSYCGPWTMPRVGSSVLLFSEPLEPRLWGLSPSLSLALRLRLRLRRLRLRLRQWVRRAS